MDYFNEAYPDVNYSDISVSPLLENWRIKMGCSGQIGNNLSNALTMTPYGMIAFQRACRALRSYSPTLTINVTTNRIVDPNTLTPIDAKGLTYDAGDSIIVNVSTFNGTRIDGQRDRFFSWSPNELLNIAGYHEIDHLVLDSDSKSLSTDGIECVFCKNHKRVIGREFKARIQFSLIYPAVSTVKGIWLSNYAYYFEVMYRLLHPKDDDEKEVSESYKKSRKRYTKRAKFEASTEFADFRTKIKTEDLFVNGYRILSKYYKSVLNELESRFKSFSRNSDANYSNAETIQVKNIVKELKDYLADENFDLIT